METGKYLASMDVKKNKYGDPVDFESVISSDPEMIRKKYIGDSRFAIYIAKPDFTKEMAKEGIFTARAQIDQAPTANFYRGLTGTFDTSENIETAKERGIEQKAGKSLCICTLEVNDLIMKLSEKLNLTFGLNNDAIRLAKRLGVPFLAEVPTNSVERLEGEKREVGNLTRVGWSYPNFVHYKDKSDMSYLLVE